MPEGRRAAKSRQQRGPEAGGTFRARHSADGRRAPSEEVTALRRPMMGRITDGVCQSCDGSRLCQSFEWRIAELWVTVRILQLADSGLA